MYSDNTSFTVPPSVESQAGLKLKKRWYQRFWGRLIIIFLALFFTLLIAMGFYVGKVVSLLRSGQLTPQQLFGQDLVPESGGANNLATTDDPSLGSREAKVVIIEFGDFECPACGQVRPVIDEILKDYGDKILFIWRDFPLVNDHPESLIAALAGECAHEQGKFWEMHDKIFTDQANITEENLKIYAVQIGLNSQQFNSCFLSAKYLKEVEEDLQAGYAAGARATPTFFINGEKVAGALPLNMFEQIITTILSQ